tara:strand:+ start:977 stop:2185 length:1209 start_codon:yes stop_codon:yes gene_type:complete
MSVTTLMEERATLYAQARAIIEKDDGEITAEEERKVDAMFSDADAITDKIQKEERTSRLKSLGESVERPGLKLGPSAEAGSDLATAAPDSEYRAFDNWMRREAGPEYRAVMTSSTNSAQVPEEWTNYIVEKLYQENVIRQLGQVKTSAMDTNIVIEGAAIGKADCVAETTEIEAADTASLATSSVAVGAFMRRPEVWCSVELLQDSSFNLESYVGSRIGMLVGRGEENDSIQGGGTTEPVGLKTQVTQETERVADSSTYLDALTYANVWDFIFGVSPQYRSRPTTAILCSDDFVKALRKMTSGSDDLPIWKPSDRYSDLRDGVPGTIGGIPYRVSPYMNITDGTLDAIIGDWSFAETWQRAGIQMFQDPYSQSSAALVKFIARMRSDFKLTQATAFSKMVSA